MYVSQAKTINENIDNWSVFKPVSYTHLDVYKRQGNGFGFGGRNAGALASELNTDANTNLLMQEMCIRDRSRCRRNRLYK